MKFRSNSKGLDCILYFLFGKIAEGSLGNFVFSWPPRSPDMKREFKEEAFKVLMKLEQEGKIPENTVLGKSVLDSAQGERVWYLLKTLCDSAMTLEMAQVQLPVYPNLNKYLQNPASALRSSVLRMKKSIVLHTQLLAENFNTKAQIIAGKQNSWKMHAKYLTQEHKTLRNLLDTLSEHQKKNDPSKNMIEKLAALDRVPQIDMLRYIWKGIESLAQMSKERKGEISVDLVVSSTGTSRKISKNVQKTLEKWGSQLKTMQERLENAPTSPIQHFSSQLREVIAMHKSQQFSQLESLKSHRSLLEQELFRLKSTD